MENGIFFSLTSLVYSLLLVIVFFSKERYISQENNIYRKIIVVNLIGLLIDIFLATYASRYLIGLHPNLAIIILKFRLIYFVAWTSLFSMYIVSLCANEQKLERDIRMKKTNIALLILIIYFVIAAITIFILPLYSHKKLNMFYTYGPATTAVYIFGGIQLISWIIIMIKNIKYVVNKKYIPILLFILIAVVVTIIQAKNPELTLMIPLQTFITFLMFFTIENPDMKMIEELEEEKDKANNASIAKTEFLSSVSHEIRNPINIISGLADEIATSNDMEHMRENAKDILMSSSSLITTVNGILDISKIEKGVAQIVNSPYDVRQVLEEIGKLSSFNFKNKNIEFSYNIAKDLPKTLLGDYLALKKIITNLLNEAYSTTNNGFVRYEVNCINTSEISKLIITIEDSGTGLKNDLLNSIFKGEGTKDEEDIAKDYPINLISAKRLTDLMGGKIIAQSVYGKGSKYTIIINQRIKEEETKDTLITDLTYLKILLVDDNPLNLKVTARMLQRFKATDITKVESGFECLEITEKESYDLIFLDDMMPKMTGVETLKRLRERPDFKTPVIALTANAIVGMKERYLKAGFDDYLAKPLEKEELVKVLNNVLNGETEKDENITPPSPDEVIPVEESVEEILNINNKNIAPIEFDDSTEVLDLDEKPNYDLNYLKRNGFNIDRALELLEDVETFNETLSDFNNKLFSRMKKIAQYKNENDLENYTIEVHSLKSDCKYLGITSLADLSYEHELKAREKDLTYIIEHYTELEHEVEKYQPIINNYLNNL